MNVMNNVEDVWNKLRNNVPSEIQQYKQHFYIVIKKI